MLLQESGSHRKALMTRVLRILSREKWKEKMVARILMESMADVIYMSNEEDIATLRQAFRVLKSGGCLGMSPEGTRSSPFPPRPGCSGACDG